MDEVVFRRTTWRMWAALGSSVAAIVFFVAASRPATIHAASGERMELASPVSGAGALVGVLGFGLVAAGASVMLRRARHRISITAQGFLDASTGIARRIAWTEVADVSLVGSERNGFWLHVARHGARTIEISLDGIEGGPQPVLDAMLSRWQRAKNCAGIS